MKQRILNFALIVTSVMAYLEWGQGNSTFLLLAEVEIVKRLFTNAASAAHPLTIVPLLGQLLLFFTLFQRRPGSILTFIGMGCVGVLLLFIFIIGLLAINLKIIACSTPFLVTCVIVLLHYRRERRMAVPE